MKMYESINFWDKHVEFMKVRRKRLHSEIMNRKGFMIDEEGLVK